KSGSHNREPLSDGRFKPNSWQSDRYFGMERHMRFSPTRNAALRNDFAGRTQATARRGILAAIVVAAASSFAVPTLAWDHSTSTGKVMPAGQVLSTGRVVKVDIDAGKITIEHKPISRFYLESTIRIFRVKDPAMLTALTPG